MRSLLVAVGSSGDVHPMIGIGRGLLGRGHEVLLIANEHFRRPAEDAGLTLVPYGSEQQYLSFAADADLWHPRRGFRTIARGIAANMRLLYDLVAEHHRPGRTIVAATTLALGARLAQDKLGLPLASVHLQPSIFRSVIDPADYGVPMPRPRWARRAFFWLTDALFIDRAYRRPLNALRHELGLPPIRHVNDWWHSPRLTIGLFPRWFAPPPPDWPPQTRVTGFVRYDEADHHALSPQVEAFLDNGPLPIVFTFGSAMMHADKLLAMAVEACSQLQRRAVLLTRFTRQLPATLPAHVLHVPYAPLSLLLPRCAAIVHHGGIGTTAQALAAGVPQLVTPFAHDQFDNAARMRRLGAGASIDPRRLTVPSLVDALAKMTEETPIRQLASQVALRMERPAVVVEQTCDLLEGMVAGDG